MSGPSISICIAQYNRVGVLLKVLDSIREQTYDALEVVISDDCSTDESAVLIPKYLLEHGLPWRYIRQPVNVGFDRNFRAAMHAASGDYLFLLGNDDAIADRGAMGRLAATLEQFGCPDVAFANYCEWVSRLAVPPRAFATGLLGAGPSVAVRTFRSFSFISGLVFKREVFLRHDTSEYDGSIYFQIFLGARSVAAGGSLLSVDDVLVAKNVTAEGTEVRSYRDTLREFDWRLRPVTGGLDQVGRVAAEAVIPFGDARATQRVFREVFTQLLKYSYPYWLFDYRQHGAYWAAVNLALGCRPSRLIGNQPVSARVRARLGGLYLGVTLVGLLGPIRVLAWAARAMRRASKRY